MSRGETIKGLKERLAEVEHERDRAIHDKDMALVRAGKLQDQFSQLKAVARHFERQRDELAAYLDGVLDQIQPVDEEPDLNDCQPGPIQLTRPRRRNQYTRKPQRTTPAQDAGPYPHREMERIRWEDF